MIISGKTVPSPEESQKHSSFDIFNLNLSSQIISQWPHNTLLNKTPVWYNIVFVDLTNTMSTSEP